MTILQVLIGLLLATFGSMGSSGGAKAADTLANDPPGPPSPVVDPLEPHPPVVVPTDPPPPAADPVDPHPPTNDPTPPPPADDPTAPPPPAADPPPPAVDPTDPHPPTGGPADPPPPTGGPTDPPPPADDPVTPPPPVPGDTPAPSTPVGYTGVQTIPAGGDAVTVMAGRVATLGLADETNVASVRVLEDPEFGNVTVNPDNTLAVVLSDTTYTGPLSFSYEVTYTDGSTDTFNSDLNVTPGTQAAGWGLGQNYMLQTDAAGDVIVEAGANSREVYISGDSNALSLADIAAIEGLPVSAIDADWLTANLEYGADPSMALDETAGMELWYNISGNESAPSSNWLLLESGYEYSDLGRIIDRGAMGESELNPQLITSYGTGDKPIVTSRLNLYQDYSENIVIQGIAFTGGVQVLGGSNILMDGISVTGDGLNIQNVDGFTMRDVDVVDVRKEDWNEATWDQSGARVSGIFAKNIDGLLIEDSFFDQNGWADGYDYNLSSEFGQPPSQFSQNVYIQYDNTDVTFRDNITMRAASYGAQVRSGGFIEDNIFLDNNAGVSFLGGNYKSFGYVGNYSLFTDNVITSAGYRESAEKQGALSWGVDNAGSLSTLIDNIITNLSDPNDPADLEAKYIGRTALQHTGQQEYYDDTMIYNWVGSKPAHYAQFDEINNNIEGLDQNVLDQTTIQIFAAQLLGQPTATISDLADYLRAQADGELDGVVDADLIIEFFQQGFGIMPDIRADADTLRFVPNNLGEGMRWDNRLNWDSQDLPGTQNGDSVDLAGNWVYYGGTTTIEDLDFGDGGKLIVTNGYLQIDNALMAGPDGGTLNIDAAGQFWTNGYSDPDLLDINIDGGRFVNTGQMDGNTALLATDGQTVLATDGAAYDIKAGSSVAVDGSDASIGFDGELGDTGVLRLAEDGTLAFRADSNGFATIEEFRTGAMGDNPNIASGVNLGLGSLELDISALAGSAGVYELISVDELIGEFGDISFAGLPTNQDASLTIDYIADTLTIQLTAAGAGSGDVTLQTVGEETDMDSTEAAALWEALTAGQGTYSDDLQTQIYVNEDILEEMVI